MELYEIKNGMETSHSLLKQLYQSLNIANKDLEVESLTMQSQQEDFWNDVAKAQSISNKLTQMKHICDEYHHLDDALNDMEEVYNMIKVDGEEDFFSLLEEDYMKFADELDAFEKEMLLSEEYDHLNAIIEIHPGAGGTESQDWAEMLFRMYNRYATKKGFKFEVLDYLDGEEAGIKSVTFKIIGHNAYGLLKSEKGVHRLVRISPFDSNKRRHTSFASLDVMPEIDDSIEVEINQADLRIDTYRASGAGGQHINKTDSAVRITHLPTGIVVSCQTQRSQMQNKNQCMVMLKSKLYAKKLEEQNKKLKEIQGEQLDIAWGSQIRSYVFCPYTLVKDNRSNYETSQIQNVMDGDLDNFIYAYLRSLAR